MFISFILWCDDYVTLPLAIEKEWPKWWVGII